MSERPEAIKTLEKIQEVASYFSKHSTHVDLFDKNTANQLMLVKLQLEKVLLDAIISCISRQNISIEELAKKAHCTPDQVRERIDKSISEMSELLLK